MAADVSEDTQLNGHIGGDVSTHHGNVSNLLFLTNIGEIPTGLVLLSSSSCDKVGCAAGSASLEGPGTTVLSNKYSLIPKWFFGFDVEHQLLIQTCSTSKTMLFIAKLPLQTRLFCS